MNAAECLYSPIVMPSANCYPRESFVIGALLLLRNAKSTSSYPHRYPARFVTFRERIKKKEGKKNYRASGDYYRGNGGDAARRATEIKGAAWKSSSCPN